MPRFSVLTATEETLARHGRLTLKLAALQSHHRLRNEGSSNIAFGWLVSGNRPEDKNLTSSNRPLFANQSSF